jgi:PAS domain S-box-containing protein
MRRKSTSNDSVDLRREADKRLDEQLSRLQELSIEDCRRLVHELKTRQLELEVQNKELNRTHSEQHLSNIIDFLPDATFAIDRDGRVIAWNRAIEEMTGVRAENILGKGDYEYSLPLYGSRRPILIDLVIQRDEQIEKEYSFVAHKGGGLCAEVGTSLREGSQILWAIAGPLCDSEGNLVGAIESIRDITERKKDEEKLKDSREQLRALARRVQGAREEERTTIAREIHDELGQTLTSLKVDLSLLARSFSKMRNTAKRDLLLHRTESMTELIERTIQTVRRIATQLRPGILDDLGLVAALEWQLQDFMNRTGIQCELITSLSEVCLEEERSTALFRIFQEALTNVARHANATKVVARMQEDADKVIMELQDNGRGITSSEVQDSKSLGLLGMRERTLFLGGEFSISGSPARGTTVTVKISLTPNQG